MYMDETWLNGRHCLQKEWVHLVTLNKANRKLLYNEGLMVGCTKIQVGKGKRIIITDAMTQTGPVDGGLWIFKAETKKKNGRQKI